MIYSTPIPPYALPLARRTREEESDETRQQQLGSKTKATASFPQRRVRGAVREPGRHQGGNHEEQHLEA